MDKKTLLIIALLLAFGALCWYVFGRVLPDQRSGVDAVRTELDAVREQQQRTLDRLGTVENGLDRGAAEANRISEGLDSVTGTVADVEERISASEDRARGSASAIGDSKRLIDKVRERGKTGD